MIQRRAEPVHPLGARPAWHDPATGRYILTYDGQRTRADDAQRLAKSERAARMEAAARPEAAEAKLRRLREG